MNTKKKLKNSKSTQDNPLVQNKVWGVGNAAKYIENGDEFKSIQFFQFVFPLASKLEASLRDSWASFSIPSINNEAACR